MTASSGSSGEMVDTNLLVYAMDPGAGAKHTVAANLIGRLLGQRRLVLSVQMLNEFYAVATRAGKPPALSHQQAAQIVSDLAAACEVVPLTREVTLLPVDAVAAHGLSFWDALIWAAARENGIGTIYTEDFQHGREIEGVRFVNPFLEAP